MKSLLAVVVQLDPVPPDPWWLDWAFYIGVAAFAVVHIGIAMAMNAGMPDSCPTCGKPRNEETTKRS